jgi:programmed cell death 6-interacting protein
LNALGLPGAIEAFESPTGIPAPLLQKLNTVRAENGVRMLTEQVELVDKVASQDEVILKESLSILDAEEKEDSDMRGQYHDRWNRTPSHTLTAHLRQEAAKHAGNLEHARKSDEFVKQKLKASADAINKLTWPTEKVVAELPSDESMGGQAQSATAIVAKLKQSIAQLTTIIQTRDGLMRQLRELAAKVCAIFLLLCAFDSAHVFIDLFRTTSHPKCFKLRRPSSRVSSLKSCSNITT